MVLKIFTAAVALSLFVASLIQLYIPDGDRGVGMGGLVILLTLLVVARMFQEDS